MIRSQVWSLRSDSENPWWKRSLSPFLGDALKWHIGTATMRDTLEFKQHVNQLIQAQSKQKTIVHIISFLIITRYVPLVTGRN